MSEDRKSILAILYIDQLRPMDLWRSENADNDVGTPWPWNLDVEWNEQEIVRICLSSQALSDLRQALEMKGE